MIPKIIHTGWVGPKPIPEAFQTYRQSMQRLNPDFDYRFFGNEALEEYSQDPYVKYMVEGEEKWAFIVDRIRVLKLKESGGIWIDLDAEPVRPLSRLSCWSGSWDFVSAFRSPYRPQVQVKRGIPIVDNTVMASVPNGRIIKRLVALNDSRKPKREGAEYGWEILNNSGPDVLWYGPNVFYALEDNPEAVILHDAQNLASWCKDRPMAFVNNEEVHRP